MIKASAVSCTNTFKSIRRKKISVHRPLSFLCLIYLQHTFILPNLYMNIRVLLELWKVLGKEKIIRNPKSLTCFIVKNIKENKI